VLALCASNLAWPTVSYLPCCPCQSVKAPESDHTKPQQQATRNLPIQKMMCGRLSPGAVSPWLLATHTGASRHLRATYPTSSPSVRQHANSFDLQASRALSILDGAIHPCVSRRVRETTPNPHGRQHAACQKFANIVRQEPFSPGCCHTSLMSRGNRGQL
jgi:hypothetical protein